MTDHESTLRCELFFGAVYGFGLGAVFWALSRGATAVSPGALLLIALAAAAGPLRLRLPKGWRLGAGLPFALAAASIYGLPAAVLAGWVAGATTGLAEPRRGGWDRLRSASFSGGVAALAAASGGAALMLSGVPGTPTATRPAALATWCAGYVAVAGILSVVAVVLVTDLRGLRPLLRVVVQETRSALLEIAVALALPPLLRAPWGAAALAGALVAGLLHRYARRQFDRWLREAPSPARSRAICRSITEALAGAGATRDDDDEHSRRVRRLCVRIGERMGIGEIETEALAAAALLHDVGRIAVPERILGKPGRLTDAERERVRVHPAVGAEIVRAIRFPFPVHPIVRHHHERWDGGGYPDGLHGEQIPLGARILAVVHAWDALVSPRPYRAAMSHDEALRVLRAESGTSFDPLVVDLLIEQLDRDRPAISAQADERTPLTGPLREAERRLALVGELRRLVAMPLTGHERLTLVAERLRGSVPHATFVVWREAGDGAPPRAVFVRGLDAEALTGCPISIEPGVAEAALAARLRQAGRPRWRPAAAGDGTALAPYGELIHGCAVPLAGASRPQGVLALYRSEDRPFGDADARLLATIAGLLAATTSDAAPRPTSMNTVLTDAASGLPNAAYLRCEAAHRFAGSPLSPFRVGAIALQLDGLADLAAEQGLAAAELALAETGRHVVAGLDAQECVVRYGIDLLVLLTPLWRPDDLVRRWRALADAAAAADVERRVRVRASHAVFPDDADGLDGLLDELGRRLDDVAQPGRAVLAFPSATRISRAS